MVRKGFTLIELIFSIVVISIIVGFYPLLTFQFSKTMSHAVEQNALYATTTRLNKIITAYWDNAAYTYNALTSTFSAATEVNASSAVSSVQLNAVPGSQVRVGNFITGNAVIDAKRRIFTSGRNATPIANFGFDANDFNMTGDGTNKSDDIDDFQTNFTTIYAANPDPNAASYSYKENIWMEVAIDYVNDIPVNANGYNDSNLVFNYSTVAQANPTNLKMITISSRRYIPNEGNVTIFTLRTYSANIGEVQNYYSRVF